MQIADSSYLTVCVCVCLCSAWGMCKTDSAGMKDTVTIKY